MAIPRPPLTLSPLENQQFQRLKVNRIAVLQELKVDHILQYLLSKSVLNDSDITKIAKGQTSAEKSKLLLDILPTKGRTSNWYNHFRAALLNPSVDDTKVKHKYQILVEFLDNTIIDQMSHPVRLSRSTPARSPHREQASTLSKYKPLPDISNNASRPPTNAATATRKPVLKRSPEPAQVKDSKPATIKSSISQTLQSSGTYVIETDVETPMEEPSTKWNMRQLKGR